MATPPTRQPSATNRADWQGFAQALLDEADTGSLAVLAASHASSGFGAGAALRFGSASQMVYRLEPDFSIDRPYGPADTGFHDGDLHRSIYFKTRQGGRFWSHLGLLALVLAARDALRSQGAAVSEATAALEARGMGMTRLLEASMYCVVNLFAQSTILEVGLNHLENDLDLLETEVAEAAALARGGLATPGQNAADHLRRLDLLRVLLDEKFAQTDSNIADSLRQLGATLRAN